MGDTGQWECDLNFANAVVDGWTGGVSIYLADKQAHGVTVVDHMVMTLHTEGVAPRPAPIKLTKQAAAILMDALWTAGLRPSGELESIGQLGALKAHLADMRQVAFKTLDIDKP